MTQMTVKHLWGLVKAAAAGWVDDYAQSMGAALAFYTMFSIAPLLLSPFRSPDLAVRYPP